MCRPWIWLQLIIGWLPVWALFTVLMFTAHGGTWAWAAMAALRLVVCAAALGLLVHRATAWLPWPHPFQTRFLAWHVLGAALRAQIHPHFLFNALHTVVQLIPLDPRGAVHAAEQLAALLRASFDEQREQLPLQEEWALVQRYLAIEGIRFGSRLQVQADLALEALDCAVPSFALQTLVENAVRHAATPALQATRIHIQARCDAGHLRLSVADSGAGADPAAIESSTGTGLRRLRERLAAMYGGSAELAFARSQPRGLTATLRLPQVRLGIDHD